MCVVVLCVPLTIRIFFLVDIIRVWEMFLNENFLQEKLFIKYNLKDLRENLIKQLKLSWGRGIENFETDQPDFLKNGFKNDVFKNNLKIV